MTPERMDELLRQLPETANSQLPHITATPYMKARIAAAASAGKPRFSLPRWFPAAAAAMCALVLVMAIGPLLQETPGDLITSAPLGSATADPFAAPISSDLGGSTVRITAGSSTPSYRSIWARSNGGSFPLIGVNGKFYRMLTSPPSVSTSLLGGSLGAVSEFTMEPTQSSTDVILSNTVAFGTPVYAVSGMGDTLVAAEVNGSMRLFQRVSFNGNALRGRETLDDTLQISGRVIAMELSGVGTITDPAVCRELTGILLDQASYRSSGSVSSSQALLIELDNGLVLQMAVKNDSLAACGVWSCPEFFEAFEDACP